MEGGNVIIQDNRIKAVVFDLGGVFLENGCQGAVEKYSKKAGLNKDKIAKVYDEEFCSLERGEINEKKYWENVEKSLSKQGIYINTKILRKITLDGFKLKTDVVQLVRELKSKGYKTAMLTNNVREWMLMFIKKFKLDEYFDVIVNSADLGIRKPEPGIYEEIMQNLSVKEDQLIFVDDTEKNIEGARLLGIKSFLFSDFRRFKSQLKAYIDI